MKEIQLNSSLIDAIKDVVIKSKQLAFKNNNSILLNTYWKIGRLIVEDEQNGRAKAKYGKEVLKKLSAQLTLEFGRGFDETNLRNIRQFYISFPIRDAVRHELSWTHYRILSRLGNEKLRIQYQNYSIDNNWDTRTLQRNIKTQYIGRVLEPEIINIPGPGLIKDPYIFEFLGMPQDIKQTENDVETALINHLREFLMELGKGFAFVARQQHIVTETADFYIDLVFYNFYLKCFVLLELKTGPLDPAAIGQMDMYVRMYNDCRKSRDDNPTIGIILCTEKDETIVKYSVLSENQQLFASKYRLYLPEEKELQELIEQNRVNFELERRVA